MCRLCVFGVFFLSQNHRSVVAFSVRPIEDMNEITSHMLDVVQAHMVLRNSHTVRNGIIAAAEHQSAKSLSPLLIHSFVYIVYAEKNNNSFLHMFFFKTVSGEGANSHMTPMSKQSTGNMDVGYGGANNVVNNGLSANQNQVRTKVKCCTESCTCINRELKTFICTAKPAKH